MLLRSRDLLIAFMASSLCVPLASAEQPIEPGGTAESSRKASFQSADYAWDLFFFLSQQAKANAAGQPDPTKESFRQYDDDHDVVWETWALASGERVNKSEVFKRPAVKPAPWEQLRASPAQKVLEPSIKSSPLLRAPGITSDKFLAIARAPNHAVFIPQPEVAGEDETRMNRNVYETVRDKELYSIEGLLRRYAELQPSQGPMLVVFDQNAKEVKARWIPIADDAATKKRYHWRTIEVTKPDGTIDKQTWGLVALHIITRDLPNWFWADFSHVDAETDFAWCGKVELDPTSETCPVDDTTRGPKAPSGTNGIRNETKGTKWENYILRGAQISFSNSMGRPTILSNPIIEQTFQKSSCITCHSHAAIRPDNGGITHAGMTDGIGPPDPAVFDRGGRFLQVDFLWSIPFRAGSETEPGPSALSLIQSPGARALNKPR